MCKCNKGNVFFGLVEVDGYSPAGFDDMYGNSFAVKWNVTGEVACNEKTFGFDPQPGYAKQCFCDDIEYEDEECIRDELAYWAEQRESQKLEVEEAEESEKVSGEYTKVVREQIDYEKIIRDEEAAFAKETAERLKKEEAERAKL